MTDEKIEIDQLEREINKSMGSYIIQFLNSCTIDQLNDLSLYIPELIAKKYKEKEND